MGKADFYVDFNIEVPDVGKEFASEAERRLREMADGHHDIVGAAVSLEYVAKVQSPFLYRVRVVIYKRPEYLNADEQHADPMAALRGALDAVEEQVSKSREKLREKPVQPTEPTNRLLYDLTAREVYATYAKGVTPEEILEQGRTQLASRLMLNEGLSEEAAYFAADQIMRVAVERTEGE